MAESIAQFFGRYAVAVMVPEPAAIAAFYAPGFVAAGPEGSATFANDDAFIEWLRGVHAFNQRAGMTGIEVVAVEERRLSERHTLATVEWGARFVKTGAELIRFAITYLVESDGESWKVLAYVSHLDQTKEMERLGLLP
jgi:hypothetical protein